MRGLRTVLAVLRTAAGLDRQQPAQLHAVRVEMPPVRALRTEQELVEGQLEECQDFRLRPVVARGRGRFGLGGALSVDRKRVVEGKSVSVRVDLGGRRILK